MLPHLKFLSQDLLFPWRHIFCPNFSFKFLTYLLPFSGWAIGVISVSHICQKTCIQLRIIQGLFLKGLKYRRTLRGKTVTKTNRRNSYWYPEESNKRDCFERIAFCTVQGNLTESKPKEYILHLIFLSVSDHLPGLSIDWTQGKPEDELSFETDTFIQWRE